MYHFENKVDFSGPSNPVMGATDSSALLLLRRLNFSFHYYGHLFMLAWLFLLN